MESDPVLEPVKASPLPLIIMAILLVFSLGSSAFFYYQTTLLQKQIDNLSVTNNPTTSPLPTLTVANPTQKPTQKPTEIVSKTSQSLTLKANTNWLSYTDEAAGITISYPPEMVAKYNPNRGAAFNYQAGSYLLSSNGDRLLDFYTYGYDGGSRREAFYKAVEVDGPEDASKFTQSATDISLNGKTYLKLTTTYTNEASPRVFYLIPVGDRLYYFTYSKTLEANTALLKTIQTIIATSTLNANSQIYNPNTKTTIACSATRDFLKEKGDTWDANIDSAGNLNVIQRLTHTLKSQTLQKNLIEVTANPQTLDIKQWSIANFELKIDPSQKGSYEDALVYTLPKAEVDKLVTSTPTTISSISVLIKNNQTLETTTGEWCAPNSAGIAYFTNKP